MLPNKHYYRSLIDNKQEPTFLADLDGDILLANPSGEKFTGYSEDELTSYSVRDLFFSLKNEPNPFDTRHLREFSSDIFLIDALRFINHVYLEFKEIEGNKFLGTIKPIEVKEIKSHPESPAFLELGTNFKPEIEKRSQTSKDKTEDVENEFDHHVRNNLNTILGFSTILSKNTEIAKDEKLKKYVDGIVKSGNDLKKIFNKFENTQFDIDEVSWGQTSILQVLQKVHIMLSSLARKNNIRIIIRQNNDLSFLCDEILLFDILNLFVEKAITYTRNEEVVIDYFMNERKTEVTVIIDNVGQDIPQSVIHFIKRENNKEQYDFKNPILGMHRDIQTLLKNLNSIDAKIDFSTSESMGEIVTLKIPLRNDTNMQDSAESNLTDKFGSEKKIYALIVEDEKINASIFKIYIEGMANVSTAFSGNEAMNIVEMFYNKGILFNIVFMDIGLPEPWDGILLKQAIEKKWPEYLNIPFIAQTAYSGKNIAERIGSANFKGYLIKPINRNDVLRFLSKYSNK